MLTMYLNAEGNYVQTKTPAHNTKSGNENAHQGVNGRKTNAMRTPFHTKTTQTQRLANDMSGSVLAKTSVVRPHRPLADKTPFVNHTQSVVDTPALDDKALELNHIIPAMHDQQPTSDSGSRFSSIRATKSLVPLQTPANQGNYWDASDGDIVIPEMEQVLEVEEEFDDLEEIEYMPPNTLDLPYRPPFDFDLPNYELPGQAVLRNVYSYASEVQSPPSFDFLFSDKDLIKWDSLSLPSLLSEDDSFTLASGGTVIRQTSKPTAMDKRSTTSRPASALASSSCMVLRPPTAASTRRAATSASTRVLTAKPSTAQSVSVSTVVRATSTTATCLTTAVYKQLAFPIPGATPTICPRKPSLFKPLPTVLTTDINRTADRATTSIVAKCLTEQSANIRPPTSQVAISKSATSTSTARPVTSTSIHPHSARARAVRRPQASTASRTTSVSETLKKPIAAGLRGTSARHSSLRRITNAAGTDMKQKTTSNKLRTKSQRTTEIIKVNPGCTSTVLDVNGVVPICSNGAKAAVAQIGNLVLDHDSEHLEQTGHQENIPLEPNVILLGHETQALAGDLDDVFVSVGMQE